MISKDMARSLLPFVNDLEKYDLLVSYLNYRKEWIKEQLTMAKKEQIDSLQGAYQELNILSELKSWVERDK